MKTAVALIVLGLWPGAALALDAYIPNQGADTVKIFDLANPDDTVTIATGDQPHEGVATRDARYVFVSNRLDDSVSVYDTLTRSEVDTDGIAGNGVTPITVGVQPHGVAITPDNRYVFVTNDGSNDVTVIDAATFQVVSTVPGVGFAPHMVAITPDGSEAWVGNIVGGDVAIIDVARAVTSPGNAVICATPGGAGAACRIATGAGTEGVDFTHDGLIAYAANGGANTVSVIHVKTRTVIQTLPVPGGPRRVHVRPDGQRAYVTQLTGGNVSVIITRNHQLIPQELITGVPNGLGMGFSADSERLYVANFFSSQASVVELPGGNVVDTIPTGQNPDSVLILPEEIYGLEFTGPDTLAWQPNVLADRYDLYRGLVGDLPSYGDCVNGLDGDLTDTVFVDTAQPLTGQSFFYLVGIRHDGVGRSLEYSTEGTFRVPATPCLP